MFVKIFMIAEQYLTSGEYKDAQWGICINCIAKFSKEAERHMKYMMLLQRGAAKVVLEEILKRSKMRDEGRYIQGHGHVCEH